MSTTEDKSETLSIVSSNRSTINISSDSTERIETPPPPIISSSSTTVHITSGGGMVSSSSAHNQNGGGGGLDNKAFVSEEKKNVEFETVNLELVDLKDKGGSPLSEPRVFAPHPQTPPTQKFSDYYVSVNEHKKGLRGEKLYVTKDNRRGRGCKRYCCALLVLLVIAATVTIAALVGTGIIDTQPKFKGEIHKTGRSRDFPPLNDSLSAEPPIPVIDNSLDSDNALHEIGILPRDAVPNVLEGEMSIKNAAWDDRLRNASDPFFKELANKVESALRPILVPASKEDTADFYMNVKEFERRDGVTPHYRLGWEMKDNSFSDGMEIISKDEMSMRLTDHLKANEGRLTNVFQVPIESVRVKRVADDQCSQMDCESFCSYNYPTNKFRCGCSEPYKLAEDGKKCIEDSTDPTSNVHLLNGLDQANGPHNDIDDDAVIIDAEEEHEPMSHDDSHPSHTQTDSKVPRLLNTSGVYGTDNKESHDQQGDSKSEWDHAPYPILDTFDDDTESESTMNEKELDGNSNGSSDVHEGSHSNGFNEKEGMIDHGPQETHDESDQGSSGSSIDKIPSGVLLSGGDDNSDYDGDFTTNGSFVNNEGNLSAAEGEANPEANENGQLSGQQIDGAQDTFLVNGSNGEVDPVGHSNNDQLIDNSDAQKVDSGKQSDNESNISEHPGSDNKEVLSQTGSESDIDQHLDAKNTGGNAVLIQSGKESDMNQSPGSENNGADSAQFYPESESDIDQHPGDENRDGNSDSGKESEIDQHSGAENNKGDASSVQFHLGGDSDIAQQHPDDENKDGNKIVPPSEKGLDIGQHPASDNKEDVSVLSPSEDNSDNDQHPDTENIGATSADVHSENTSGNDQHLDADNQGAAPAIFHSENESINDQPVNAGNASVQFNSGKESKIDQTFDSDNKQDDSMLSPSDNQEKAEHSIGSAPKDTHVTIDETQEFSTHNGDESAKENQSPNAEKVKSDEQINHSVIPEDELHSAFDGSSSDWQNVESSTPKASSDDSSLLSQSEHTNPEHTEHAKSNVDGKTGDVDKDSPNTDDAVSHNQWTNVLEPSDIEKEEEEILEEEKQNNENNDKRDSLINGFEGEDNLDDGSDELILAKGEFIHENSNDESSEDTKNMEENKKPTDNHSGDDIGALIGHTGDDISLDDSDTDENLTIIVEADPEESTTTNSISGDENDSKSPEAENSGGDNQGLDTPLIHENNDSPNDTLNSEGLPHNEINEETSETSASSSTSNDANSNKPLQLPANIFQDEFLKDPILDDDHQDEDHETKDDSEVRHEETEEPPSSVIQKEPVLNDDNVANEDKETDLQVNVSSDGSNDDVSEDKEKKDLHTGGSHDNANNDHSTNTQIDDSIPWDESSLQPEEPFQSSSNAQSDPKVDQGSQTTIPTTGDVANVEISDPNQDHQNNPQVSHNGRQGIKDPITIDEVNHQSNEHDVNTFVSSPLPQNGKEPSKEVNNNNGDQKNTFVDPSGVVASSVDNKNYPNAPENGISNNPKEDESLDRPLFSTNTNDEQKEKEEQSPKLSNGVISSGSPKENDKAAIQQTDGSVSLTDSESDPTVLNASTDGSWEDGNREVHGLGETEASEQSPDQFDSAHGDNEQPQPFEHGNESTDNTLNPNESTDNTLNPNESKTESDGAISSVPNHEGSHDNISHTHEGQNETIDDSATGTINSDVEDDNSVKVSSINPVDSQDLDESGKLHSKSSNDNDESTEKISDDIFRDILHKFADGITNINFNSNIGKPNPDDKNGLETSSESGSEQAESSEDENSTKIINASDILNKVGNIIIQSDNDKKETVSRISGSLGLNGDNSRNQSVDVGHNDDNSEGGQLLFSNGSVDPQLIQSILLNNALKNNQSLPFDQDSQPYQFGLQYPNGTEAVFNFNGTSLDPSALIPSFNFGNITEEDLNNPIFLNQEQSTPNGEVNNKGQVIFGGFQLPNGTQIDLTSNFAPHLLHRAGGHFQAGPGINGSNGTEHFVFGNSSGLSGEQALQNLFLNQILGSNSSSPAIDPFQLNETQIQSMLLNQLFGRNENGTSIPGGEELRKIFWNDVLKRSERDGNSTTKNPLPLDENEIKELLLKQFLSQNASSDPNTSFPSKNEIRKLVLNQILSGGNGSSAFPVENFPLNQTEIQNLILNQILSKGSGDVEFLPTVVSHSQNNDNNGTHANIIRRKEELGILKEIVLKEDGHEKMKEKDMGDIKEVHSKQPKHAFEILSGADFSTQILGRHNKDARRINGAFDAECKDPENEFKCIGQGDCLPKTLRCNGIYDCRDGSDELLCEDNGFKKEDCKEFQCPNGPCIPSSRVCDGHIDCLDSFDELDCHKSSGNCSSDEFYCVKDARCIPMRLRCDGTADCVREDEDERNCECDSDKEFKCLIGGGCIDKQNLCDGVEDCPDLSDELNCLKVSEDGEIQIRDMSDSWSTLCLNDKSNAMQTARAACEQLGYVNASLNTEDTISKDSSRFTAVDPSISLLNDATRIDSKILENVTSCDSNPRVTCEDLECSKGKLSENQKEELRIQGTINITSLTLQNELWPSLAYLFNVKRNTSCIVTILKPRWLITSHSCMEKRSMNPEDWVAFAGPSGHSDQSHTQIKAIKRIISHPSLRYRQGYFTNDLALIELNESLEMNDSVQSSCLGEASNEQEFCFLAGWADINREGVSFRQYLDWISLPMMNLEECNSSAHYNGLLNDNSLCTSSKHSDVPCRANSGAPLLCYQENGWKLLGVLSKEGECLSPSHPDIFTSIQGAEPWIKTLIG